MKILLFANTDWYLYNFRLPLAKYLREKGLEVILVSSDGPYGHYFEENGFRWIPIPMNRRSLNPWTEIKLLFYLTKLYIKEKPDLVHHFTIKCVVYGSLAAQFAGIKSRINAITGLGHVFTTKTFRTKLLRPFVSYLLRFTLQGTQSRLILQNPDDVHTIMQAHLALSKHIRLICGSGVDTKRFQPFFIPKKIPKIFKVLLATRLLWEKGVGEYVEAARILNHNQTVKFFLAGSPDPGNPASVSLEQIMAWEREGIITVLGHLDNMELFLKQVDLAVLPSYREGVPRSLLEAAACGLPIVTTDAPGCREVVANGINGLLVPCKDSTVLAEAIQYMMEHPQERKRMGVASRNKVLAEFDQKIIFKKTFRVYKELLPLME
ncbi:glycosyltransferase family 4 protein [Candidatus Parabeggiatoa sp. HSG14]|uniref:glycosyltransferase family 4 protein n=1 Tax=Candidatus Parabeggiatoa sp. HSG14 TaxID=3055593 RepID=UPI0025A6F366|nr:glycosyltransferase family 4 protein [Thiotrichales bacterium HSG14]